MLWTCLHFPDFSLQLLLGGEPDIAGSAHHLTSHPLIVTTAGNRPQVLSCNAPARSCGIAPGMMVSAAIALAPDLLEHQRNAPAERRALERLAAWAGQFTSLISLDCPDTLLLEIAGSLRLFGGLRGLLLQLSGGLAELGYAAAIAVAPTPTAARLLARAGLSSALTDSADLPVKLANLPLTLLDQPRETIRMLTLAGVHTIGECLALPRDGLAHRFGQGLLDELDRALGRLPDPREPFVAPARYSARLALPAPVQEVEPLLFAAKRLILELAGWLRTRQAGVTRLKLVLHHEDRKPSVITLGFAAPSRDPLRIVRLLRERLSRLELPERVEVIRLQSEEAQPLDSRNLSLFPEDAQLEEERWSVIDHLRARLGVDAVYSIASSPDHRPEAAWRICEPGTAASSYAQPKRPLWLLTEPKRLRMERDLPVLDGPLTLLAGPERIESGWWDGNDVARDYFIAADAQGRQLWVFRERRQSADWFLHGLFA